MVQKNNKKLNIKTLLKYADDINASDLHTTTGYKPIIRLDGSLKRTDLPVLSAKDVWQVIEAITTEEQFGHFEAEHELDFAYELPRIARFRCNCYMQMQGPAVAFRIIPANIMTLKDIGAPEGVYTLARMQKGLILVTGPTGSGKSTTLAAIINLINKERRDHVLTIEDPIEYVHKGINCMINQREIGIHSNSFASALRASLREDPDVILVGEMRDLETIALAITAAETGHLVLGTLHTSSAPESVDRVIDVFPSDQQNQIRAMFSSTLQGVISQKLIPKKGGKGRICGMEVLIASTAIRNLIRERKTHQMATILQTSSDIGMQTMDQGLMNLLNDNKIVKNEAMLHAQDKRQFEDWKPVTRDILEHVKE